MCQINKNKKELISVPVVEDESDLYHLRIPSAAPEIVSMSIGEGKTIQWGDHITITKTATGFYQITKKDTLHNSMLTQLDNQKFTKNLSIVPDYYAYGYEYEYQSTQLINQLSQYIKVCYVKHRNHNAVKKSTYYVQPRSNFTLSWDLSKKASEIIIKMPFALQTLSIYFSPKYMGMHKALKCTLSEDENYIEIRNQFGNMLRRFFIKGTLFNIDTQSAEPLSATKAIQLAWVPK